MTHETVKSQDATPQPLASCRMAQGEGDGTGVGWEFVGTSGCWGTGRWFPCWRTEGKGDHGDWRVESPAPRGRII